MRKKGSRAMKQADKTKSALPFSRDEILLHITLAVVVELLKILVALFVA